MDGKITEIHTLVYTPSCFPILKPILIYLRDHRPDLKLSVTALWDPEGVIKVLGPNVAVFANADGISQFLKDDLKKRFLLSVADFNHPAHRVGYQVVTAAKQKRIPCLSVQHGTFGFDPVKKANGFETFSSDKIAVWGNRFAEALQLSGISPERVVVTGNPRFDGIPDMVSKEEARQELKKICDITNQDKVVVLAMAAHMYTTVPELRPFWNKEKVIRLIGTILSGIRVAGIQKIIVRPHPAEYPNGTAGWYKEAAENVGIRIDLNDPNDPEQPSLYQILRAADLTITQYSSTGIESVLLGTPSISVIQSETDYVAIDQYVDNRGFFKVAAPLETLEQPLAEKIRGILSSEILDIPTKEFIEPITGQLDGKASERIVTVMEQMLNTADTKPLYDLPFDRYQRFTAIADRINELQNEGLTILDVGSHDDVFAKFVPGHTVLSVDKDSGVDGTCLPYQDNEFDIVTSIDVLEHVPPQEREPFISELVRVAKQKAFLAFPSGPLTEEAERFIFNLTNNHWLKEHIENRLPTFQQTENILEQLGVSWVKHENGNLASWFSMLLLNHLPNQNLVDSINAFFNQNFYNYENRGPAYRVIYEIDTRQKNTAPSINRNERRETTNGDLEVSIIIPTFNKVEMTRRCIAALRKNTQNHITYEIILVDNNSTDETCQFLQGLSGNIKVILNDQNMGFGKACNQGAQLAHGNYLVFLNNDTEPLPGWLDALLEVAKSRPKIGVVGCKLLYPNGTVQHAGVGVQFDLQHDMNIVPYHIYAHMSSEAAVVNKERSLQAVTGACMLISHKVFQEVEGFDEGYYNGYEDIDLCFRIKEHGYQVIYTPKAQIIHHESASGPERFRKVQENVTLLNQRWQGKIISDDLRIYLSDGLIARYINEDGSLVRKLMPVGKTSIIILTRNQLDYTRLCLESIFKYTSLPFEIILVDNGSNDGTLPYLRRLVRERGNVRLIANTENLGFAKGNNQGLAVAEGEYIIFLNNDCVVTEGWLERLLDGLEIIPGVGAAGPCSNYVVGQQLVSSVPYASNDMKGMQEFAKRYGAEYDGKYAHTYRVIGFCLLVRREAIQKIGGFDPEFGMGNYEDDDFCLRLYLVGYRILIAMGAFVHHFGNRTFVGEKIDYQESLQHNWERFKMKWGIPKERTEKIYSPSEILEGMIFTPQNHRVAIPGEELQGQLISYFTVVQPELRASWQGPLSWYVGRHKPGDLSSLVLAVTGEINAFYRQIETFLKEEWNLTADDIADVLVTNIDEIDWKTVAGQIDVLLVSLPAQVQNLKPLLENHKISIQNCPVDSKVSPKQADKRNEVEL